MNEWTWGLIYLGGLLGSWIIFVWDSLRRERNPEVPMDAAGYFEVGLMTTIGALVWPLAWFFILVVGGLPLLVRQIDTLTVKHRRVKL